MKKKLTDNERLRTLNKDFEDLTEEEIDLLRRNSDMGDPNAWKVPIICDRCANQIRPWVCYFYESDEMRDIIYERKCKYFIQRK